MGGATGGFGPEDFPDPVGTAVVVIVGCLLLALGAILWLGRTSVTALAAGNSVTAAAALVWLLAASGFSSAGAWLLGVTIAGLAALAAAQAAAGLRQTASP